MAPTIHPSECACWETEVAKLYTYHKLRVDQRITDYLRALLNDTQLMKFYFTNLNQ